MKITLTFLLLGVCLALTNGFILNNLGGKKKQMGQKEAYATCRMVSVVMKRWSDWQRCHACTDLERFCMEKAIVEDLCFIASLLAADLGCTLEQLLGKAQFKIQFVVIIDSVKTNNFESLTRTLRTHGMINHFVETMCSLVNAPAKEANVDMANVLGGVSSLLGGVLEGVLGPISNVLGGAVGGVVGAVSGVANALGGVTGGLGGLTGGLGGVTGGLGGLTGGLGGLTGGLGGLTGGLGGATDALGGLTGGLTNAVGGVVGGIADTAGGLVGGVTNALGGLTGGLLGGGGKKGGGGGGGGLLGGLLG